MAVYIDGKALKVGKKIEQLPKEFVDFALERRFTNGNYFWNRCLSSCNNVLHRYQLDDIALVDRPCNLTHTFHVLSLMFVFSTPDRTACPFYDINTITYDIVDPYCYEHNLVHRDSYCVDLAEGTDECIYEALVKLDIENDFPFHMQDFVIHW